jgi:hypothetical protein
MKDERSRERRGDGSYGWHAWRQSLGQRYPLLTNPGYYTLEMVLKSQHIRSSGPHSRKRQTARPRYHGFSTTLAQICVRLRPCHPVRRVEKKPISVFGNRVKHGRKQVLCNIEAYRCTCISTDLSNYYPLLGMRGSGSEQCGEPLPYRYCKYMMRLNRLAQY